MRLRINRQRADTCLLHLAEQRIDLASDLDLIAPQFDAEGVVVVSREDFDDVAAHAKRAAPEIAVVAVVQDLDQLLDDLLRA